MDNQITVREILESYDEIAISKEIADFAFLISLYEKQFLFLAPLREQLDSRATVYLYNDDGMNIPHIMLYDESFPEIDALPDGKYRWICLYESESIVNTIVPYEDKIIDAIDRLIELLSMNDFEKEREFQKEFMFYWNSNSVGNNRFNVYLSQENLFSEMSVYYHKKTVRIIERGVSLSDINDREGSERKWVKHLENDVYYIPISDSRDILPPHRGYDWSVQDIRNIVYGKQIEHIDDATANALKNTIAKTQNIILVFGMKPDMMNIVFAVKVICKHPGQCALLEKILNDAVSAEPLTTDRKDYLYLSEQIGNDIGILKKKILIVGAGSLGSYVASEIVKNGVTNIKIYDGDKLEDENICRWVYGGFGKGANKAQTLALLLNWLHPEINVVAVNKNIEEKSLIEEMAQVDLIIFTVGNSDVQLKLNKVLKDNGCSIPVIFTWLEAGGIYSHVMVAFYQKNGCFECLYTNEKGCLINNRALKNVEANQELAIIRNGCGGTRAAYGTAIILRTTAALIDTVRKIQEKEIEESILIDISPDSVKISETKFPMEVCKCCGYRGRK